MFNLSFAAFQGARPAVVLAGAVMDSAGVFARPGALAISEDGRVVFAGPPEGLPEGFKNEGVRHLRLPDRLLVPGMVNAHAHLDLAVLGQWPYPGDFIAWVKQVMEIRGAGAKTWEARYRFASARMQEAGVSAVGDIVAGGRAGDVWRLWQETGLQGVVFDEQFGHGEVQGNPGRQGPFGIQPHAPYSAGPALFEAACKSGLPLSTHLAETPEEAQFVASASGPFQALLERLGKWRPEIAAHYSGGKSSVRWMEPYLRQAPWLLAHVNYANDADLAILAETGASVAYCPVASDYFLHKNHRYRDMLAAGINVCLGTDSMICQPESAAQPLGILPQMRHLFRRDGVEAQMLLKMATVNGAKALGLAPGFATFAAGAQAMPVALKFDPSDPGDPLAQVLRRNDLAESLSSLFA